MPDLCCITVQCKIAQNAPYSVIMQSLQSASAFGSGSTTTSRASKSFPDCRRAQCILNHLWQENTRPDTRESAHQKVWFASNHILCSNIVCEPVQPNLCKPWPWHLLPAQRPRLMLSASLHENCRSYGNMWMNYTLTNWIGQWIQ